MSFLCFNQGEGIIGELLIHKQTVNYDLILKLYKNDHALADSDTEADYTEADFTGYGAKTLTGASWTVTPGAPTLLEYAEQLFESTADQAAQSVYGYILVQQTSGKAVCGWRFDDGPYVVSKNGDKIYVTPTLQILKVAEA